MRMAAPKPMLVNEALSEMQQEYGVELPCIVHAHTGSVRATAQGCSCCLYLYNIHPKLRQS
jgi:hypothetical protein